MVFRAFPWLPMASNGLKPWGSPETPRWPRPRACAFWRKTFVPWVSKPPWPRWMPRWPLGAFPASCWMRRLDLADLAGGAGVGWSWCPLVMLYIYNYICICLFIVNDCLLIYNPSTIIYIYTYMSTINHCQLDRKPTCKITLKHHLVVVISYFTVYAEPEVMVI